MSKELLNFKGLFGDHSSPFKQVEIHHESLRTRSSIFDFEIQEHLHDDLVQIFFIQAGGGFLLNAGRKIKLESPCVLVIPSNTLHGFAFQSEVRGDVFTLAESLYDICLKNGQPFFLNFDQLNLFYFNQSEPLFHGLNRYKDQLVSEITKGDLSSTLAIPLLLQLFLLAIYRSQQKASLGHWEIDNRTLNHFQTFKKLLKQHIFEERTVRFYAKELGLSLVHLNRICQAIVNKSTLQVIHDQIHMEAKKFLSGTTYSISEVAYFLGFKDPAHFSKFFKKQEGKTPKEFRKNTKA